LDLSKEVNLFERLQKFLADSSLVGCALEVDKGKDESSKTGILGGCVYSVVEAKNFYAEPTETLDGQHVHLVGEADEMDGLVWLCFLVWCANVLIAIMSSAQAAQLVGPGDL